MSPAAIGRLVRPTARIITISVDQARKWVENHNPHNRAVSTTTITRYATLMNRGEWMLTCEPIMFDWNGNLLNGQHRLMAIIASGKPQQFLVVKDLNPSIFPLIDTQHQRRGADCLSILKVKNYAHAACATQMVSQWYRMGEIGGYGSVRVNNMELVRIWQNNIDTPHMNSCVTIAARAKGAFSSICMLAAVGYLLGPPHLKAFEKIVKDISTGEELRNGDPILALLREMAAWTKERRKPGNREIGALLVKAVTARLQERSIKGRLKWEIAEPFPAMVGTYVAEPAA